MLLANGCVSRSEKVSPQAGSPESERGPGVIEIPGRELTFVPSRDDITVARVTFSVASSSPDSVKVNGARLDPAWLYLELTPVARNRFKLEPLRIEHPVKAAGTNLLCISVKAWFQEVTTQYDSMYYENLDDRYALISWCTHPPESAGVSGFGSRFKQNRVETVEEFKEVLTKPIPIRLNKRPLREEWSR
ncbi:MAG TPA: hypothetical protein DCY13_04750 [Verrucomicrobiales bacterium]|nr:hypothetical protein [Verrucomicrobiales bacterium]